MIYEYCSALGQDSHRFEDRMPQGTPAADPGRPLVLGGIAIPGVALAGNSDADVVLHALTNAVSGLTGVNILGKVSDELCLGQGITDSRAYLRLALDTLGDWQISHLSFSIEGKRPHLANWIPAMKESLAQLTGLTPADIGLTATTGEGLTDFGRGDGLQVFCQLTARRIQPG
jgi:2-C-methyl-D-erythritol 2,4-cyclodiphosphate synthase